MKIDNDNDKNNNTIAQKINNLLGNIEDIIIYNGKVVYSNLEKNITSLILILKKGINDLI